MTSEKDSFDGLGLAPKLLEILDKLDFKIPTPIQKQSIPVAIEGKDIMGIAQTGTGKTMAFGLPLIQRLAQEKGKRALVILPTRELALQVNENLLKIGRSIGLKTAVLMGGDAWQKQIKTLSFNPHVIIGTPGRINEHLEKKTLDLSNVKILVLDEADRMLDMGFAPQINRIVALVPKDRQTLLFSATMPQEIVGLATKYMKLPIRVEVAPPGTLVKSITQEIFIIAKNHKPQLLEKILEQYKGSVLLFCRTKFSAKKIAASIRSLGHTASEIHSNRSLSQRIDALNGFKLGRYRILVATDIAARGIDVTGIEVVLNYDLPENPDDYVHRIGRTARAGHTGHAISFADHDQLSSIRDIEKLIKKTLTISPLPADMPAPHAISKERAFRPARTKPDFGSKQSKFGKPKFEAKRKFRPRTQAAETPSNSFFVVRSSKRTSRFYKGK